MRKRCIAFPTTNVVATFERASRTEIPHPRSLFFFYPRLDVTHREFRLLTTFGDFVSACGGNVGLFLGVSGVSVIAFVIRKVEDWVALRLER